MLICNISYLLFAPVFNSTLYVQNSTTAFDAVGNREKHGWLGDAQVTAEEAMQNFDMVSVYEEFLVSCSQRRECRVCVFCLFGLALTACPLYRT